MNVAEAILEQLQLWGVKRIYGVVGDAVFGLMDALAKQETITFISVKHESVAALMASAEAKLTGQLGVCLAQMGPGLANLINGLGDAYMDKAPVLAITGQAPLNKIGTPYKQYINQQELVQAISTYSQLVVHPDAVIPSLTQAIHTSLIHRTVSHLSISADLFQLTTTIRPSAKPLMSESVSESDMTVLQQVLQLMRSANQPMILIGSGARSGRELIQSLSEKWGCGIAVSYGATGILQDEHPFLLNGLGEGGNPLLTSLFQQADVILAIETSWWPEDYVPSDARVIQMAKHRADLGVPIPLNIGLVGDTAYLISQLLEGLSHHPLDSTPYQPNSDWLQQIRQCKQAWSVQRDKERNQSISPLHPASIIRIMEQQLTEDAIVALDEGDSTLWFKRCFRAQRQHVLLSKRWRTMGFGLPAAMAAKLCWPDKQVVCITGDGGLGMVLADMLTASRYGLAITVIVFNNSTLQMELDKMRLKGLQPEGTTLMNPEFAKVAVACGWNAYRIETVEQLEKALQQTLSIDQATFSNEPTASNQQNIIKSTSTINTASIKMPTLLDVQTAQIPYPDFK